MANQTTTISVQIDAEDKKQATEILQNLGVTMSELINMTIKQVILKGGIPFDITLPKEKDNLSKYFSKKELKAAAKELKDMEKHPEKYKSYNNIEDLFKDLENDD